MIAVRKRLSEMREILPDGNLFLWRKLLQNSPDASSLCLEIAYGILPIDLITERVKMMSIVVKMMSTVVKNRSITSLLTIGKGSTYTLALFL